MQEKQIQSEAEGDVESVARSSTLMGFVSTERYVMVRVVYLKDVSMNVLICTSRYYCMLDIHIDTPCRPVLLS
jgi:hypothetical protein